MVEATGSEPRKGKIQRHGCVDFNFGNPKYPGDNWWSMINVSFELIFIYQCYKLHHLGSFAYFDQIASKHQNGEQLHAMCWDTKGDTTSSMILRSQGADRRSQITNDNSQGWVSQRWFIFGINPKLACYCRFFLPAIFEGIFGARIFRHPQLMKNPSFHDFLQNSLLTTSKRKRPTGLMVGKVMQSIIFTSPAIISFFLIQF